MNNKNNTNSQEIDDNSSEGIESDEENVEKKLNTSSEEILPHEDYSSSNNGTPCSTNLKHISLINDKEKKTKQKKYYKEFNVKKTYKFSEDDYVTQETRKIIEKSPNGRFSKFNEILGRGAQKTVYKAFDSDEGREVAWNSINVNFLSQETLQKIQKEVEILKLVKHPNILSFIYGFFSEEKKEVVVITEIFSGGNLKHYLTQYKNPRLRVLKIWCKEILKGLYYLHNLKPPIIHRDIKCDNILVNKANGEVKIGDLGFSVMLKDTEYAKSFNGTVEFCSPEIYQGKYGVKADIYSFGMTLLEMCTGEVPYKECEGNVLEICNKAVQKQMPKSLDKIRNKDLKDFILNCLKSESERPSAEDLLNTKFLNDLESEENNYSALEYPPIQNIKENVNNNNKGKLNEKNEEKKKRRFSEYELNIINIQLDEEEKSDDEIAKILLIKKNKGKILKIKFDFIFHTDTIKGVLNELQQAISLNEIEKNDIENKLKNILLNLKKNIQKEKEFEKIKNEIEENYKLFEEQYLKIIKDTGNIINNYKDIEKDNLTVSEMEEYEKKIKILKDIIKEE